MASSTLATPTSYHKSTPSIQKNKLESKKVRSEDELLKFFLHGSYDVQRGNLHTSPIEENPEKPIGNPDETTPLPNLNTEEQKTKSRCMFEETYMINISVKQPDAKPSSKQIDVRIEKALSDAQRTNDKIDDDEISSIFDEEDNDEVESVIFNEINSPSSSESPRTKLTLADMINKTLTTMPAISVDNLNQIPRTNSWYFDQQNNVKIRKRSEEILPSKPMEKVIKTPPPPSASIQQPTLTTNMSEDKKLFEYLDYLETKEEEANQQPRKSSPTMKTSKSSSSSTTKIPLKFSSLDPIPIIDLEQLCRSLTVNDLKDEYIRKKIYELKILIDERHQKHPSQIPLVKPRKDNLPILIAMPPVVQQRRRTLHIPPSTFLHSKTGSLQAPNYPPASSNYTTKHSPPPPSQYHISGTNANRKYQYT